MPKVSLLRSRADPEFLEIIFEDVVVQEVKVSFKIPPALPAFSCLEEVLKWLEEMEYKLTKAAAYRFLGRRSYSKEILFQKLRGKKFGEVVCQKVIEELEKLGYLSDEDFGEMAILQKMRQGYGPFYIERYVGSLGIDPGLVRKVMSEEKQKESLKKWFLKLKRKERGKIVAFLLRRGFDLQMIQRVSTQCA